MSELRRLVPSAFEKQVILRQPSVYVRGGMLQFGCSIIRQQCAISVLPLSLGLNPAAFMLIFAFNYLGIS